MGQETFVVIVKQKGARQTQREIEKIGGSARKASKDVSYLKRALQGIAVVATLRILQNTADAYTQIGNRIRVVTKDTQQFGVVQDRLFEIANKTRAAYEATAESYSRTAIAAAELGITQEQVLEFTENLNKAVAVGGARAKEAINGIIQLSQGVASNRLGGEEFRSVTEQLPIVAKAIADQLGATRGDLIKLAEQGKITSDVVIDAMLNAGEELETAFAKINPTIEQSLIVARNNFIRLVGEFDQANGISRALAKSIIAVSGQLDNLAKSLLAVSVALAVFNGPKGWGAFTSGVKKASLAMRALVVGNPILLLVSILAGAITAVIAFRDQIKFSSDGVASLGDYFRALWRIAQPVINAIKTVFEKVFEAIEAGVKKILPDFSFSLEGLLRLNARYLDFIKGIWVGLFRGVKAVFDAFPLLAKKAWNDIKNIFVEGLEATINFLADKGGVLAEKLGIKPVAFDRSNTDVVESYGELGSRIAEAFGSGMSDTTFQGFVDRIVTTAKEIAEERKKAVEGGDLNELIGPKRESSLIKETVDKYPQIIAQLERELGLLQLTGRERERQAELLQLMDQIGRDLTEPETRKLALLQSQVFNRREEDGILQSIRGEAEQLNTDLEATNRLLQQGRITLDEWRMVVNEINATLLEKNNNFFDGVQAGFIRIGQSTQEYGKNVSEWVVSSFEKATDALIEFVNTGKLEFRDLINSMINDLLRLQTQRLFIDLFSFFGSQFASGAAGGGAGDGAFVDPPSPPGGPTYASTSQPVVQQQAQPTTVTILNALDPRDVQAALEAPGGDEVILNLMSRNPSRFRQALGA